MNDDSNIKLPDKLKNIPFSVPDNYFDRLPDSIMKKCTGEPVRKLSLWQTAKPILTFAAGFLILFGLSRFIIGTVTSNSPQTDNYLSQTYSSEINQILNEDEINDEMQEEIITYIVDEHYVSMIFVENEYLPY
jgi:hypothetical protein